MRSPECRTGCRRCYNQPRTGHRSAAAEPAAAGTALGLGSRVGVLNLNGALNPRITSLLGMRLRAQSKPQGVNNTTDLLTPEGKEASISAAKELAEVSDVIMFGCTGFSTIGLAAVLRPLINVPIVDAVEASGGLAWQLLSGMQDK